MAEATSIDDRDKPSVDWKRPPEPPIHRAARRGDIATLERLIAEGADIDERADLEFDNGPHLNGLTTLMVAARSIDGATVETLRWLVEHGADIHARSEGTNTAAWYAAGHGGRWEFHARAVTPDHVERLRYLLDLGLDVNERNFVGRSLLTEACAAGDPARVSLLLERGADPSPDWPLVGERRLADRLTAAARAVARRPAKGSVSPFAIPIHLAASSGSAECVDLLVRARVDPNTRDDGGATPLMGAASAEVVRSLVAAGADVRARDEHGGDALEHALEHGCGCEYACPDRRAVVGALLEAGAPLHRVDEFGKNRLESAAFGRHAEGVEILLGLGVDPNLSGRKRGRGGALHSICWQGEDSDPEANAACERIIRALVAAGADVDARAEFGRTPIHEAVEGDWGNQTAVRVLAELGADVNARAGDDSTPLMAAAAGGAVGCVEALLAAGADPALEDEDGETALDLARAREAEQREIVTHGHDPEVLAMLEKADAEMRSSLERETGEPPSDDDGFSLIDPERDRSLLAEARRIVRLLEDAARRAGDSEAGG